MQVKTVTVQAPLGGHFPLLFHQLLWISLLQVPSLPQHLHSFAKYLSTQLQPYQDPALGFPAAPLSCFAVGVSSRPALALLQPLALAQHCVVLLLELLMWRPEQQCLGTRRRSAAGSSLCPHS